MEVLVLNPRALYSTLSYRCNTDVRHDSQRCFHQNMQRKLMVSRLSVQKTLRHKRKERDVCL